MANPDLSADKSLAGVTAVILAGGLGTRLCSVVADRPKVLAEIHEQPFLAFLLDQLICADIRHVVLCVGYLGEQLQSMFGNSYGCLQLAYSQEASPLGHGWRSTISVAIDQIRRCAGHEWRFVLRCGSERLLVLALHAQRRRCAASDRDAQYGTLWLCTHKSRRACT